MRRYTRRLLLLWPLCLALLMCAACRERTPEPVSRQVVIDGQSAEITFDPLNASAGTVEAESGFYTFSWERTGKLSIIYPDGSVYTWSGDFGSGTVGEGYLDGLSLAWALERAYQENRSSGGGSAPLSLAVLLLVVGVWLVWKPRSACWLAHGWRYKNAGPSDLALGLYCVGGGLLILVGVICLLASL